MEIAVLSHEDKTIAQYLRFTKNKTVWEKLLIENEDNLGYVEDRRIKYKLEF